MPLRARTLFAAALMLAVNACLAQSTPQYRVKESIAPTGSLIKRYVVQGSSIPVNRTYEELTPEQKVAVNSYYEAIPPGDEPPFPLEGLKPIYGAIAAAQQKLLVKGELILVASIDAQGNATQVKAIGSPSAAMTQAAARIIVFSRFKPAMCSGVPCPMDFPFRFVFVVE